MGFFSRLSCVSQKSIPAFPYAERPENESKITIVFFDDSTISGTYDGYGRVGGKAVHELAQAKLVKAGKVKRSSDPFGDDFETVESASKWLLTSEYNGQKFAELEANERCPYQGYFYDDVVETMPAESQNFVNAIVKPKVKALKPRIGSVRDELAKMGINVVPKQKKTKASKKGRN